MGEIKKVQKKYYQKVKKHEKILKTFTRQEKLPLIFMIILLQAHLKLDIKQDKKGKDLKY